MTSIKYPTLEVVEQKDWWILKESFSVEVSAHLAAPPLNSILIPAGFKTDLASVPKVPGIYALFKGSCRRAALIHDYIYSTGTVSRKTADDIFYHEMLKENVPVWKAKLMWLAVRVFGKGRYNRMVRNAPPHGKGDDR